MGTKESEWGNKREEGGKEEGRMKGKRIRGKGREDVEVKMKVVQKSISISIEIIASLAQTMVYQHKCLTSLSIKLHYLLFL